MELYRNRHGHSGVIAFEIGETFIKVKFRDGPIYLYDYGHPGKVAVEEMKRRARSGNGLSTYISQNVRENYARKIS